MSKKGWPRDLSTGPNGGQSTGPGGGLSYGPGGDALPVRTVACQRDLGWVVNWPGMVAYQLVLGVAYRTGQAVACRRDRAEGYRQVPAAVCRLVLGVAYQLGLHPAI